MEKSEFKEIEDLFISKRNPERSDKMEAYLKHKFTCLGITSPERKEILKSIFQGYKWNRVEMMSFADHCYQSQYREIHYAGLDILAKYKKKLTADDMPALETKVTAHSWWDTVDSLASNPIGQVFYSHPEMKMNYLSRWVESDNMWLRRTAILHQLKYKSGIDTDIMEWTIEKANGTKEFFLNKAIGWMLREYAKVNPDYVRGFCEKHDLSTLSKREALKNIG